MTRRSSRSVGSHHSKDDESCSHLGISSLITSTFNSDYFSTMTTSEHNMHNFTQLLNELQAVNGDPRGIRKAAVCAALMETAKEHRQKDQEEESSRSVTPNEMFLTVLAALTSLQSSCEAKMKNELADDANGRDSLTTDLENTALPLLEILRRMLPFVAHWTNNHGALLAHQFGAVSRMLRLFVALGYALTNNGNQQGEPISRNTSKKARRNASLSNGEGGPGGNALLRQILKTSTVLLLVAPTNNLLSEKELAKLLHGTVISMLYDTRPKVRKAAWSAAKEIIMVASSSSLRDATTLAEIIEEKAVSKEIVEKASKIQRQTHQQRKTIADFLWEYSHAVLSNYSPDNNKSSAKLIHVLRFLASSLPYADDVRIRVRFGEGCLTLLSCGQHEGNSKEKEKKDVLSVEIIRETFLTLVSCLERMELDNNDNPSGTNDLLNHGSEQEELSKFSARALAFLLQNRPSSDHSSHTQVGDLFVLYGRCMLTCMERMIGVLNTNNDGGNHDVPPSRLLAMKLFPNVLISILHSCEAPSGGATDGTVDCAEAYSSEFNQLISLAVPFFMSIGVEKDNNGKNLCHTVLELVPLCIPILQKSLQIHYRNAWGSILPGGYATFISALALPLLELKGIRSESIADRKSSTSGDDVPVNDSDVETKMLSWIKTLVVSLLRLYHDVKKDGIARTAVEYATSEIIRGVGLELFLSVVDFVDDDYAVEESQNKKETLSTTTGGGIRDDRAWLLALMKHAGTSSFEKISTAATSKTHLSFFQGRVLSLARRCDAASADGHRTAAEASIQRARVIELWASFSHFCIFPLDMRENFPALAKTLVKALGDHSRYPKLISIICGGLKTLTIGVMDRAQSQLSPSAKDDYDVLCKESTKILPSLFKLVENLIQIPQMSKPNTDDAMEIDNLKSTKEKQSITQQNMQLVESVTDVIGQLAQVCPRDFLLSLFKKVIQRLLIATTEASEKMNDKEEKDVIALRMCSLLGLGQALIASGTLDDASLSLLYRAIRPLVRTDEHDSCVQKRAYKVLAEICKRHKDFVTSSDRLDEMINLIVDSIVTCQVSARYMRLKCMTCVVEGFDSSNEVHMAVIPKIMGEVLLCLKDSNAKTREAAYQLLLAMATARDDITEFFKIILAALGAQTPHMRSAATMALSRLTFEYARQDYTVQSLLPSLMQTVTVLFDESAREVIKSVISFVRVCVAAMTADQLKPLLPDVVGGLMKYNRGRDRFRGKIKIILKKLIRVYGYDAIVPFIPESDTRLMTHIRKVSERAARRKAAGVQDGRSSMQNEFENMMDSEEDDSDEGKTLMTGMTGFTKMTSLTGRTTKLSVRDQSVRSRSAVSASARSKMSRKEKGPQIRAEQNGEILDMLDESKMARSVHFADQKYVDDTDFSDEGEDGDDFLFDSRGKIVITDGIPKAGRKTVDESDVDSRDDENENENSALKGVHKRQRVSKFENIKISSKSENNAISDQKSKKQQQSHGKGKASLGSAYKSKKSGGDVKKKGQKYEPYAYVPLNAKDYTKKNRDKAVSRMGEVVHNKGNKRKRGDKR